MQFTKLTAFLTFYPFIVRFRCLEQHEQLFSHQPQAYHVTKKTGKLLDTERLCSANTNSGDSFHKKT